MARLQLVGRERVENVAIIRVSGQSGLQDFEALGWLAGVVQCNSRNIREPRLLRRQLRGFAQLVARLIRPLLANQRQPQGVEKGGGTPDLL